MRKYLMGYTKRDKQTINSDIFLFKPDKWFKIRFYIVGEVKYKDYKKRKRGEGWFTYHTINVATGASKQQIRKCIKRLRERRMIETRKETRGFTIKVLKYNAYQDVVRQRGDTEETEGRHGGDTEEDTITKEVEEVEEEKNIWVKEFLEKKDGTVTYLVLNSLTKHGYTPSKAETIDTFRQRCKDITTSYEVGSKDEMRKILLSFDTYWVENNPGKKPKRKSKLNNRLSNNLSYKTKG